MGLLTAIRADVLIVLRVLRAGNESLAGLQLQLGAGLAPAVRPEGIHSTLEGVALPSEEVIAVLAMPSPTKQS